GRRHECGNQERAAKRGCDIGHDALQEDEATPWFQARGRQDTAVLEIALAPTPITLGIVEHVIGTFFVRTAEIWVDADGPAIAREKCGLDIVMAQDMPAERGTARQDRETAALREGAGARDGIVAPERSFRSLECCNAT